MSKGQWRDGGRAWERLGTWRDDRSAKSADGDGALTALADIGLVRRLLDQAELVAVRTARQHRKSWAEIATKLGVTRQSAWERWRDLDETTSDSPAAPAAAIEAAAVEQIARTRRRQSTVVVPNVIGQSWDIARHRLQASRLVAVGPDPDGPPLAALGWPRGVVTDQSPESGAKVPPGSPVTVWLTDGGGGSAGVREPRRPKPTPTTAREHRFEPTDDAFS